MIASQKLGMLMPKSPKVVPRLSSHEFGLEPAQTPNGMASSGDDDREDRRAQWSPEGGS